MEHVHRSTVVSGAVPPPPHTPHLPFPHRDQFNSDKMGIYQVFLFDPDGNVIEISNCAPPIGETTCMPRVKGAHSRL